MKIVLLCLVLGVLPASGQVEPVAVYTQFEHEPDSSVVQALRQEVTTILAPAGLRFEWRSLSNESERAVSEELAVVTFKGSCIGGGMPDRFQDGALGWTHVSDGSILPFADVDCDRIRGFLKSKMNRLDQKEREEVLGRAIGRVLVHELYHIFTETKHHGSEGLDQPAFSVQELMDEHFHGVEEVQILRPSESLPSRRPVPVSRQAATQQGSLVFERNGCASCHGEKAKGTSRGPALNLVGKRFNSITLAARLSKDARKMLETARRLKVRAPSLAESDIQSLVAFLNTGMD